MKKKFWISGLVLVLLILAAEYDLTKRVNHLKNPTTDKNSKLANNKEAFEKQNSDTKVSLDKSRLLPDVKTKEQGRLSFENQFLRQAQQIGQIQNDPATAELELKSLSKLMQPSDIKHMRAIAEDVGINGDDRALAIELLARNQTRESLNELADFVASQEKKENQNWSRGREFETVLRAQAIEGIGIYPERTTAESVLQNVDKKISESFLKDRIARTRASLSGHAPTPEQQDEQALRKLVE